MHICKTICPKKASKMTPPPLFAAHPAFQHCFCRRRRRRLCAAVPASSVLLVWQGCRSFEPSAVRPKKGFPAASIIACTELVLGVGPAGSFRLLAQCVRCPSLPSPPSAFFPATAGPGLVCDPRRRTHVYIQIRCWQCVLSIYKCRRSRALKPSAPSTPRPSRHTPPFPITRIPPVSPASNTLDSSFPPSFYSYGIETHTAARRRTRAHRHGC